MTRRRSRHFVLLWTLATVATVCAFIVHLALRGRTLQLGDELGRAQRQQAPSRRFTDRRVRIVAAGVAAGVALAIGIALAPADIIGHALLARCHLLDFN